MKKILSLALVAVSLFALTNEEVAKKSDEVTSGFKSSSSTLVMTLINQSGEQTVRQMRGKTLEKSGGDKSLIEFISPADVKGTKLLTYEHIGGDDDQWLYLPALKRVKRIASSNKSGSFMGSEFSYEDIANPNYKKFSYPNGLSEESFNGKVCYKGVRIPNYQNSGYTKEVTLVDKNNFLVQKVDYYDRKSELLKTAIFSDYKKIGGVWRVGKIVMTNHQSGKKTILEWRDDRVNVGLSDKDFTKRVLKR